MHRLAIGVMTGTSLDAVDAAALRIKGAGLDMTAEFVGGASVAFGAEHKALVELAGAEALNAGAIAQARAAYGARVAEAVARIADAYGAPSLVALSGQTVFHRPPLSWQLCDPWTVARAARCPVVHDLRSADLSAGGQGAPITPLADWVLFRTRDEQNAVSRAIVNLGGFCNVTAIPAGAAVGDVSGFDVCVCNQLLNEAARRAIAKPIDKDGQAALSGHADPAAVDELATALRRQRDSGRSLGEWPDARRWIKRWIDRPGPDRTDARNALASAAEGVGRVIGETVRERAGEGDGRDILLAGGGARNQALVEAIARASGGPAGTTDDLGVPIEFREAACIAVLGALAADGVCVTLPQVTGAHQPIPLSGSWVNARVNLDG